MLVFSENKVGKTIVRMTQDGSIVDLCDGLFSLVGIAGAFCLLDGAVVGWTR